ncbi:MAG: hypothetical protein U0U66_03405 [Cytophagaceae bacterium]
MKNTIIKGVITNYTYQEDYDDKGIMFRLYTLIIDKTTYKAITPKDIILSEDLLIIASVNEDNEIDSGIVPSIDGKWGPNSGILKSHISDTDQYKLICGYLIKKRKTDDHGAMDVGHNKYVVLELDSERHIDVPQNISDKINKNDFLLITIKNNRYILIYNKTQDVYYGKVLPFFMVWWTLDAVLSLYLFYMFSSGSIEAINFYAALGALNIVLLLFSLSNYSDYKWMKAARKLIQTQL